MSRSNRLLSALAAVIGQAGAYAAPAEVWEEADNRKQYALVECSRRFSR